MKRLLTVLLMSISGCALNTIPTIAPDSPENEYVEKMFIGIPFFAGMEGSRVIVAGGDVFTVAHNKPLMLFKDVNYDKCDFATYKSNHTSGALIGSVSIGDKVKTIGYPLGMPLAGGVGIYVADLTTSDGCVYGMTDAPVMSGMSGGGVFNMSGELVGVIVGITNEFTPTVGEFKLDEYGVFYKVSEK